MKIKTDHKWRNFVYAYGVPKKVLASDFDYQDRDDVLDGFFRYRGSWYHMDQFSWTGMNSPLKDWSGYYSDTYFSGIVIRVSSDGEQYQIGTYFS